MNEKRTVQYTLLEAIWRAPSWLLIGVVRGYQFLLSPLLGPRCRSYPTCSEYFIGAVQKWGVLRGTWRGICRICRCHPFHPG